MPELKAEQERRRRQFVEARELSGLTQEAVALRLGKSTASISRKERGEQPVSSADVLAMEAIANEEEQSRRLGRVPRGTLSTLREESPQYGTAAEAPPLPWPTQTLLGLQDRADAFEWEMVRAGADNTDAKMIRDRVKTFLRAIAEQSTHDPDSDLETYLDFGLRPWVLERIKRRAEANGRAIPDLPAGSLKPLPHSSTSTKKPGEAK